MLRGRWGAIIAAIGLTLLVGLGSGAYLGSLYGPNEQQDQAVAGQQGDGDDYQGPANSLHDIAGLPRPVERVIANPRPQPGEDTEQRDLAAQEAMALWAFWMVAAALGTLIVTSLGTILIWRQVRLTREAVEDTGLATVAMNKANEIAQDASRAWVVCDDVVLLEPVKYLDIEQIGPRYEARMDIVLKNTGQGLARRVFVHSKIVSMLTAEFEPALASIEADAKEVIEAHYKEALYRGLPISPGQSVRLRHGFGGPIDGHPTLKQVEDGAFFIIGYISYLDHFGREQSSVFAFHPDADSVRPWDQLTLVRSGAIGDAT